MLKLSSTDPLEVGRQLYKVFTGCGFVYLVNHGIPEAVTDEVFDVSKHFFEDHEVSVKQRAFPLRFPVDIDGYLSPGSEKLDNLKEEKGKKAAFELREAFDISRLDSQARFPDYIAPKVRPVYMEMASKFVPLSQRLLQAISLSLGLERDFFTERHQRMMKGGNRSNFRSIYYPPIEGEKQIITLVELQVSLNCFTYM